MSHRTYRGPVRLRAVTWACLLYIQERELLVRAASLAV